MNISTLNTAVVYVTPNTALIQRSIEEMLKQNAEASNAFEQTNYLPSVYAKAKGLHSATVLTQRKLDAVTLTLKNDTATALKALNDLRAEAGKLAETDDLEDNVYFRESMLSSFKKSLKASVGPLQQQYDSLTAVKFDPASTTTYKTQLDAELVELSKALATSKEKMAALESSRTILSEAMAVFEKKNLADTAKEMMLTVENISALGVAAPEVEVIKFAIAHMKKTMENFSESLNYQGMYEQRERLIEETKSLTPQVNNQNAEVEKVAAKARLIISVQGLYEHFFIARVEYSKFVQSVVAFTEHLENGDPATYEDRLVAAAPYFIDYLK